MPAAITELRARSIGRAASAALASEPQAAVNGLTSRGIFLLTPASRVVFVSFEMHRGPLTINLAENSASSPRNNDLSRYYPGLIRMGSPVRLAPHRIAFVDAGITVAIDADSVWHPAPPPGAIRSHDDQLQSLKRVTQDLISAKGAAGFGELLPCLIPGNADAEPGRNERPEMLRRSAPRHGIAAALPVVLRLRESLRAGEWAQAADSAGRLIGLGRGLTPSGDDFIVGLLLVLNRSRREGLESFSAAVAEQARKRTTALSAGLIECAANGEADERLIAAADGILTGRPEPSECVRALSDWGASSGVDALAGMAAAIISP